MKKIIFICTGNTCRSPMAEAIAHHFITKNKLEQKLSVYSRGVAVIEDSKTSNYSIQAVDKLWGLKISSTPTQLLLDDLQQADIVLTMTEHHKHYISNCFVEYKDKISTLWEYAYDEKADITDPFGQDQEVYISCANQLYKCIDVIINKIIKNLNIS